jgi:hypothetical protein
MVIITIRNDVEDLKYLTCYDDEASVLSIKGAHIVPPTGEASTHCVGAPCARRGLPDSHGEHGPVETVCHLLAAG